MEFSVMRRRLAPKETMAFITHCVGLLGAFPAAYLLLGSAKDDYTYVGAAVYSFSLVAVYAGSVICHHGFGSSPEWQDILNRLDHAGILFMIAGTYTPICLITLRGAITLLTCVWVIAWVGIYIKLRQPRLPKWSTAVLYIGLGSLILLWLPVLVHRLPGGGVALLLGGGATYIIGAVLWVVEWPNLWPGRFGHHELMHLVVGAASYQHFLVMLWYIVPHHH